MKKIISMLLASIFLFACSNSAIQREDHNNRNISSSSKRNEIYEYDIYMKKYGCKLRIKNYLNLNKEEIKRFNKELESAVIYLNKNYKGFIQKKDTYYITLHDGNGISYSNGSSVHYYRYLEKRAPIIHELSHAMFGYDPNHGSLTQEGLAINIQYKYKEYLFPNEDIPIHHLMKYFIKNNYYIPIDKLTNENISNSLFEVNNNEVLSWISYVEAGSFSTYLIDRYGAEKYALIYNQPSISIKIQEVYKKSLKDLEKEWLNYIDKSGSTEDVQKLIEKPYYNNLNNKLMTLDFPKALENLND
ncbi:hypothetical protein [Priestia megaterium]|uniref:hypothetical protein n=1 Tax=Priestia megaterium TaxID=1404 RepID=UPI002EBE11D5|nr:hypothetical protein [Priestia megaterium]